MSVSYKAVGWNRQKRRYDAAVLTGVALVIGAVAGGGALLNPNATIETHLIRALAVAAFILLHVVLSIGPLCRLDPRLLPLLYNRRHLGVTMFLVGLAHSALAIVQFHGFGVRNPLESVLTTSSSYSAPAGFPFQVLGLAALGILFLMAATSHDFWLHNLTPTAWKTLHMGVYLAYALIVAHVALGALQSERSPALATVLIGGVAWIVSLHVMAALKERRIDEASLPMRSPLVDVGSVADIPDARAIVRCVGSERVAIFRYGNCVSAISNVCRHQNGPLGEGKIVGGCVVCPWHGYEYLPDSGASPPPFTEKVETFTVHIEDGRILLDPRAHPPGTRLEPARIS